MYRLFSYESRTAVVLRVEVPREAAKVPSVADLFRTADWHEREAAEMFGVEFTATPTRAGSFSTTTSKAIPSARTSPTRT